MKRPLKNETKRNEKILAICKAAAGLFNKQGYLETNMEDVAAAAKLSKGGIYHYFSAKHEILFSILDYYLDVIINRLEEELVRLGDPSSKIKFIISRHIELYSQYSAESKALLHDAHCLPDEYYRIIAKKEREYYRLVAGVLFEFFGDEVKITKSQMKVMTFLLFGMCNWIYSWYHPGGPIKPYDLSEMIWTVFLNGVQKYKARKGVNRKTSE
jgi:AcrR family transcriptional regulator